jgi:hypothetical protein
MAAEIFNYPGEDVRPAGQPLIFSIQDTGTAPDRFVVVVKSSDEMSGGTPTQIGKFYLTPNTEDVAFFDLSPLAESALQFPLKNSGGVVHSRTTVSVMGETSIFRFIVEVGSYDNGTETLNEDSEQIFLTNGTQQIADGLHPSFSPYYWGNSIGWLSERTLHPYIGTFEAFEITMRSDEERTISLLAAEDMGNDLTAPKVRYAFEPKSGALVAVDVSVFFASNTEGRMRHVPIGWENIQGLQSTYTLEQLKEVRAYMVDGTTEVGSVVRVRYDDTRGCRNTATQVAWINTLGGWEYLRFDSRAPKQISVDGKTYRKTIGTYGEATFSFDAAGSQYDTFAKTGKEQYTLQENFFDAGERALLDSLMKSRLVQIRRMDEDVWKPVTVLTNSLTIQPAGSQFYNVSLQVEIAQDIRC